MTDAKRKFLANVIADLGKILVGAGAFKQVFSTSPNWFEVTVASLASLALFVSAFFTYPEREG